MKRHLKLAPRHGAFGVKRSEAALTYKPLHNQCLIPSLPPRTAAAAPQQQRFETRFFLCLYLQLPRHYHLCLCLPRKNKNRNRRAAGCACHAIPPPLSSALTHCLSLTCFDRQLPYAFACGGRGKAACLGKEKVWWWWVVTVMGRTLLFALLPSLSTPWGKNKAGWRQWKAGREAGEPSW